MAYDNSNTGFLARNTKKEKPTHPDYRGTITVTAPGTYYLSGWVKEGKPGSKMDGQKFFSLALTPAEERPVRRPEPRRQEPDLNDDIPF